MATFKTKPRGDQANFSTTCHCGGELTISNGRVDRHDCQTRRGIMGAFQDALGDYYDSGAIGEPPTLAQIEAALDNR